MQIGNQNQFNTEKGLFVEKTFKFSYLNEYPQGDGR